MDIAHLGAQEYTAGVDSVIVDDVAVSPSATIAFSTSPVLSQVPQSHKTKSASKSSLVKSLSTNPETVSHASHDVDVEKKRYRTSKALTPTWLLTDVTALPL